jgi:hypothetical protein
MVAVADFEYRWADRCKRLFEIVWLAHAKRLDSDAHNFGCLLRRLGSAARHRAWSSFERDILTRRSGSPKALRLLHASCGLTRKQTDKSSLCKITLDDFEWPQMGSWLHNDFSVTDHHRAGLVFCGK